MEDRQEKVLKYLYSPLNSQSLHLQSEVRMLEERLKNLEYLKQTYEYEHIQDIIINQICPTNQVEPNNDIKTFDIDDTVVITFNNCS